MSKNHLIGRGIDVSRGHHISDADYKYIEPGNLYLLRDEVGVEVYDYLYSHNFINETKYYRILLYEWFLVVKEGGYIIIEFEDNEILDYGTLKREIATLFLYTGKHKIVEEQAENKNKRVIIRKMKSIERNEGEINQWTFGMVTNGKRRDFIERSINSIRSLEIPHYEIIICGTYYGEVDNDINYIHFTKHDDKGWITKKKNLICENAKFENIVIIHDRIYFDKEWFNGIKKWGNYFDVLSCPVMLPQGSPVKFTNWETVGPGWKREDDYKLFHSNGGLDFSDWDENVYVGGPIIILKKSIWNIERWNENLFWGDAEDIEYSLRQHRGGIVIRFNPYSKIYSSTISGIVWNAYYEKDSKKLGRYHCDINHFLILFLKFLDLLGFRRNQKLVNSIIKFLKKKIKATDWRMKT